MEYRKTAEPSLMSKKLMAEAAMTNSPVVLELMTDEVYLK